MASDGGGHIIQLSDEFGCVLRPKMISRFLKAKGADERASVITYAFFHAFKFPDALSVHIKCKVEICRHGCLDHCQLQPEKGAFNPELAHYITPLDRKDDQEPPEVHRVPDPVLDSEMSEETFYDDIIQEGEGGAAIGTNFASPVKMAQHNSNRQHLNDKPEEEPQYQPDEELDITALPHKVRN